MLPLGYQKRCGSLNVAAATSSPSLFTTLSGYTLSMAATAPVAVITGASRGIGRAIALALAQHDHRLVLGARDASGLEALVRELPVASVAVPLDLREAAAGQKLIDTALERFGRIDVLVNNAGIAPRQHMHEASLAILDDLHAVNIRAVHATCLAAWFSLGASQGVIINISSLAAFDPFPGFQLYGASKAWVNLYTQALAAEGSPLGIRAYSLALGAVATDLLHGLFPDFPAAATLAPTEVAAAVVALLNPALAPASGQTIKLSK